MRSVSKRGLGRAAALVVLLAVFASQAAAAGKRGGGEYGKCVDRLTQRVTQFVVTLLSRLGTPPGGG